MTTKRQSPEKKSDASPKGGLVQFRADDVLLTRLSQVADRLHVPVGVLARLWVSERLEKELSLDISMIRAWIEDRYQAVDKVISDEFRPGPIQLLHLIPFQRDLQLDPESLRSFQGLLAPVERVDEYTGRINLEGYQTAKRFKSEDRLAGTVQVFRNGQIESIREIYCDENYSTFADRLDDDLIRAVWSYSCVLEALQVKPPVALVVGFKRVKDLSLKSGRFRSPSAKIDRNEFQLQEVTIHDWSEVVEISRAAETVKRILDQFANAAGVSRSMSYAGNGDWLGPLDKEGSPARTSKMAAKTEILELAGTNRSPNRIDLVLNDAGESFVVGKVRAPYLEPTSKTRFRCLVNEDEMSPGAKERLQDKLSGRVRSSFSLGKLRFSGRITRIKDDLGAGAFDGIKSPQERVLMFEIEPVEATPLAEKAEVYCAKGPLNGLSVVKLVLEALKFPGGYDYDEGRIVGKPSGYKPVYQWRAGEEFDVQLVPSLINQVNLLYDELIERGKRSGTAPIDEYVKQKTALVDRLKSLVSH